MGGKGGRDLEDSGFIDEFIRGSKSESDGAWLGSGLEARWRTKGTESLTAFRFPNTVADSRDEADMVKRMDPPKNLKPDQGLLQYSCANFFKAQTDYLFGPTTLLTRKDNLFIHYISRRAQ